MNSWCCATTFNFQTFHPRKTLFPSSNKWKTEVIKLCSKITFLLQWRLRGLARGGYSPRRLEEGCSGRVQGKPRTHTASTNQPPEVLLKHSLLSEGKVCVCCRRHGMWAGTAHYFPLGMASILAHGTPATFYLGARPLSLEDGSLCAQGQGLAACCRRYAHHPGTQISQMKAVRSCEKITAAPTLRATDQQRFQRRKKPKFIQDGGGGEGSLLF